MFALPSLCFSSCWNRATEKGVEAKINLLGVRMQPVQVTAYLEKLLPAQQMCTADKMLDAEWFPKGECEAHIKI
jgi:hypothetical protein